MSYPSLYFQNSNRKKKNPENSQCLRRPQLSLIGLLSKCLVSTYHVQILCKEAESQILSACLCAPKTH